MRRREWPRCLECRGEDPGLHRFFGGGGGREREAANRFPHADLVLFHAIDRRLVEVIEGLTAPGGDEVRKGMWTYAGARLNEIVERLLSERRRVVAELVDGDPVEMALATTVKHGVELIVAGVAPEVPLGRFRTLLARRPRVPVLLVPSEP